jgi:hypothetical protein
MLEFMTSIAIILACVTLIPHTIYTVQMLWLRYTTPVQSEADMLAQVNEEIEDSCIECTCHCKNQNGCCC